MQERVAMNSTHLHCDIQPAIMYNIFKITL